jgi:hypothetical protein
MDDYLLKLLPDVYWQVLNLFSAFIICSMSLGLCLVSMDKDDPRWDMTSHLFGVDVPLSVLLVLMRLFVTLLACSSAVLLVAQIEVLFLGSASHKATEILLNVVMSCMFISVYAFHKAWINRKAVELSKEQS